LKYLKHIAIVTTSIILSFNLMAADNASVDKKEFKKVKVEKPKKVKKLTKFQREQKEQDRKYNLILEMLQKTEKKDSIEPTEEKITIKGKDLPVPTRSLQIGSSYIVYAKVTEFKLDVDSQGNSIKVPGSSKNIKLRIGDTFGDWYISSFDLRHIEYTNKKNQDTIKKYY